MFLCSPPQPWMMIVDCLINQLSHNKILYMHYIDILEFRSFLSCIHRFWNFFGSRFIMQDGMPDICILEIWRSDLNRLNFEGFYTVLLEQNEELISVATIRWVYDCATTKYQAVGFAWNVIAFLVWFAVYVPSHFMVFWLAISFYRVFGQKVAEVPLIGTRIQYRRLGMCRILMDELEKVT